VYYNPIVELVLVVLNIYWWIVVLAVIASWLVVLRIVNTAVPLVRSILRLLDALTEPVFRQVRRIVPPVAGFDFSPFIVLIAIWFIQYAVVWSALRFHLY